MRKRIQDIIEYVNESCNPRIIIATTASIVLAAVVVFCVVLVGRKNSDDSDSDIATIQNGTIAVDNSIVIEEIEATKKTGNESLNNQDMEPNSDSSDGNLANASFSDSSNGTTTGKQSKKNNGKNEAANQVINPSLPVITQVPDNGNSQATTNNNSTDSSSGSYSAGSSWDEQIYVPSYDTPPSTNPDPAIETDSSLESDANDGENWSVNDL